MLVKHDRSTRVILVFTCFALLFGVIGLRILFLTVWSNSFFREKARSQHEMVVTLAAQREPIVDRFGVPLALNHRTPSSFIDPQRAHKNPDTIAHLAAHYPAVAQRVIENPRARFVWLKRRMTDDELQTLQDAKLTGVHVVHEPSRFYPHPACAPVVGTTNVDNVGIEGIELSFDATLRGDPAQVSAHKDARSRKLRFENMNRAEGNPGSSVSLTLDHHLQYFAHKELAETVNTFNARCGAALIMNPDTGEILAMAVHHPQQDSGPVRNSALTDVHEPGSVIKIFSSLAALEEGVVTPDEIIDCEGKATYFGSFKVENWKPLGELPFREVVRQSSNIGTAKVAERLGDKLYDHLTQLGFGKKSTIRFPGEQAGIVHAPHTWSKYSPLVLSFGYELTANVLQLGTALSVIANGGFAVTPRLDLSAPAKKGTRLYRREVIEEMRSILENPRTIFPKVQRAHPLTGFRVMGKTGTARKIVDGAYSDQKHVYSFAGIVEKGDYRRVIITMIEEPKQPHLWASSVTAPLFQKIAERVVVHETLHAPSAIAG